MKALHIMFTMSPKYGGPVAACKFYCEASSLVGIKSDIYTTNVDFPNGFKLIDSKSFSPDSNSGITYFSAYDRMFGLSPKLLWALIRNVKKYDIIHIHGLYRFTTLSASIVAYLFRVPFIIRPHGSLDPYLFHQRKNRLLKRFYEKLFEFPMINKSSGLHFTSEDEAALVNKNLNFCVDQYIIPIGPNIIHKSSEKRKEEFKRKYGLKDKFVVAHFGRITKKKGINILIKAVGSLHRSSEKVALIIAGPDNEGYSEQVQRWVQEEKIEDITVFLGMLEGEQKANFFSGIDVFCLPSYSENFGMSVIEAVAAQKPVIISDSVNIHQVIKDYNVGIVVKTGDVKQTADAIMLVCNDSNLSAIFKENGNKLINEKFSKVKIGQMLKGMYLKIINL